MQAIIIPKLGLTMEEGTIVSWIVREGDQIEKGDILFEVETDKAINEVTSSVKGTLGKILCQEGQTVDVLSVVGYILEPGESPPEEWSTSEDKGDLMTEDIPSKDSAQAVLAGKKVQSDQINGESPHDDELTTNQFDRKLKAIISPRAKKLAVERGIPIESLTGTGPGGRITEDDVRDYSQPIGLLLPSRYQKVTAERLTESFSTIPHFYLRIEIDASNLVAWRAKSLPEIEQESGLRVTITDLLVLVLSKVLPRHPKMNATWTEEGIRLLPLIHIGIAMSIAEGLVVPVLKDTQNLRLDQITAARNDLVAKASSNKLSLEDLDGGTFTITNLGMYDIDDFDAIINPGQSAILAVGQIADRVVAYQNQPVIKPTMKISLACDHRVLDGAEAARFLKDLKKAIEQPDNF